MEKYFTITELQILEQTLSQHDPSTVYNAGIADQYTGRIYQIASHVVGAERCLLERDKAKMLAEKVSQQATEFQGNNRVDDASLLHTLSSDLLNESEQFLKQHREHIQEACNLLFGAE